MTHPIFEVPLEVEGRLWLMPAPDSSTLESTILELERLGVARVVSLLDLEEAHALGIADEAEVCTRHGVGFTQFPIADFAVPAIAGFAPLVADIAARLSAGESMALHCRAGIGRTGTAASCVLQALGHDADRAMRIVARARGTTIPDTAAQRDFIERYSEHLT